MTGQIKSNNKMNWIENLSNIINNKNSLEIDNSIIENIEKLRQNISKSKIFAKHPDKKSTKELIQKDSTPPEWGQFLYKIVKSFRFHNCLELGTCLGFSGAYIMAALPPSGKLISIEGLEDRANIAHDHLKALDFNNFKIYTGQFSQVLPNILKNNKFDFAFIDGHHKERPTLKYFDMIYPQLFDQSLIIIDDIHWPTEMKPAWDKIKKDDRISRSFTLGKWGLCVINKHT